MSLMLLANAVTAGVTGKYGLPLISPSVSSTKPNSEGIYVSKK